MNSVIFTGPEQKLRAFFGCKHNIPSSDGDEGVRGYGIVMFAAKPMIPYPPAM